MKARVYQNFRLRHNSLLSEIGEKKRFFSTKEMHTHRARVMVPGNRCRTRRQFEK